VAPRGGRDGAGLGGPGLPAAGDRDRAGADERPRGAVEADFDVATGARACHARVEGAQPVHGDPGIVGVGAVDDGADVLAALGAGLGDHRIFAAVARRRGALDEDVAAVVVDHRLPRG